VQRSTLPSYRRAVAVIFDFDDTLADSLPARLTALQQCLGEHLGRPVPPLQARAIITGAPYIDDQLRLALGDDPAIPALVERYRHYYYHPERAPLEPFGGIRSTLLSLQQQQVTVGMVTSRYRAGASGSPVWGVVHELQRMGLQQAFATIVGYEDTEGHKPSPEPFLWCCQALGLPPSQVLAVGDTPFDIQGARDAGAVSAAALWGTADPRALLSASPDVVLHTPVDLLAHVHTGP